MRNLIKISSAALVTFSFAVMSGCKDKEATTDTDMVTPADTAMAAEPDTTAAATVNDSNVSGVTSGEMEQVP
jgi:hypothetical protein